MVNRRNNRVVLSRDKIIKIYVENKNVKLNKEISAKKTNVKKLSLYRKCGK